MNFPLNLYFATAAASFLTTLIALPLWRSWSHRVGLVDDPGHRKIHHQPVALAGGLAVLTGLIVPLLAGLVGIALLPDSAIPEAPVLEYGFRRRAVQLAITLGGAVAMVFLGWLDDKHELRPSVKFAGQFVIATAVAASGIRITLFVENLLFSYVVTVLWILTLTNAFNFMDNMNGLCGGIGAISAWCFAWSAAVQGQYLVALLAWLAFGALLGFLPYNFPKATAFLGDAGSHLVGYLMAVLAILPHFYTYTADEQPKLAVLRPLLILGVPLADLVWVVVLRWRSGRPFYIGDTNHLSHRLVRRGWTKTGAVLLLWLASATLGALSFLLGSQLRL